MKMAFRTDDKRLWCHLYEAPNCSVEGSSLSLSIYIWRDHNWPLGSNEPVALRCAAFCHWYQVCATCPFVNTSHRTPFSPNVVFFTGHADWWVSIGDSFFRLRHVRLSQLFIISQCGFSFPFQFFSMCIVMRPIALTSIFFCICTIVLQLYHCTRSLLTNTCISFSGSFASHCTWNVVSEFE